MKNHVKIIVPLGLALLLTACGNDQSNEQKQLKGFDSIPPLEDQSNTTEEDVNGDYYFSGLIDHKYAISLHLQVNQQNATGTYYYHSQRKELSLQGTLDGPNIDLDEFVKEKRTGHFSGTTYGTDSMAGSWESPKGKKLDFVLYHADQDKYEKYKKEQAPKKFDLQALKTFRAKFKTVSFPFEYEPLDEEAGEAFTDAEIKTFALDDYDPDTYWGYHYYYGLTYETAEYTAFLFTEDYYPGAFGIHNLSLVMLTVNKAGDLIDKKYLGCHCMDTNMGSNDYYATDEKFYFTEGNIRIGSVYTHATLIEEESETEPFEEIENKTRNVSIDASGKIGATGF